MEFHQRICKLVASEYALIVSTEDHSVFKIDKNALYSKSVDSEMKVAENSCCVAAFNFSTEQGESILAMIDDTCLVNFYNEITKQHIALYELPKHEKLTNCRYLDLDLLSG